MSRAAGTVALAFVAVWVIAHLLYVGPLQEAAEVLGGGLVVVGLLHYRDTEPQGEVRWLVLGLVVLVGAAIVHW
jgi:hypothetical protein